MSGPAEGSTEDAEVFEASETAEDSEGAEKSEKTVFVCSVKFAERAESFEGWSRAGGGVVRGSPGQARFGSLGIYPVVPLVFP